MKDSEKEEAALRRIAEAAGDLALGEAFSGFVARCRNRALEDFLEAIDQSEYSAKDWVEAFLEFDAWLPEASPRNFRHLLGYLHCCQSLIPPGMSRPKLSILLQNCLQEFGYQGVINS